MWAALAAHSGHMTSDCSVRLAGVASASRAGKNRSLPMSKLFVAKVASASRGLKDLPGNLRQAVSMAIVSSCAVVLQRGTRWLPPTVQVGKL